MRQILFWIGVAIVALACNVITYQKEQTLAVGRQVFLKLRPVDPRSLMQGDYMVLAYELAGKVKTEGIPADGRLIVQLDDKSVGTDAKVDDGTATLGPQETLLQYRNRKGLRIGAESFFFQEGHAQVYNQAKFAELRVAPNGESVLVGLRGEDLAELKPPPPEPVPDKP